MLTDANLKRPTNRIYINSNYSSVTVVNFTQRLVSLIWAWFHLSCTCKSKLTTSIVKSSQGTNKFLEGGLSWLNNFLPVKGYDVTPLYESHLAFRQRVTDKVECPTIALSPSHRQSLTKYRFPRSCTTLWHLHHEFVAISGTMQVHIVIQNRNNFCMQYLFPRTRGKVIRPVDSWIGTVAAVPAQG